MNFKFASLPLWCNFVEQHSLTNINMYNYANTMQNRRFRRPPSGFEFIKKTIGKTDKKSKAFRFGYAKIASGVADS